MYTSFDEITNVLEYFADLSGAMPHVAAVEEFEPRAMPPATLARDMPDIQPHQYYFIDWTYVSSLDLSTEQYCKYAECLHWDIASKHVPLDVALAHKDKVHWDVYLESHDDVDVGALIAADVDVPWYSVCTHTTLSENEIRKYLPLMEQQCPDIWHYLSRFQKLGETLVEENADKFDWVDGPYFQNMTPEFLRRYMHLIDTAEFHDYGLLPM